MSDNNFRSSEEIDIVSVAINDLMKRWGLQTNDWMLGKNLSLYYFRALKKPTEVNRDVTIHVNTKKVPWKIKETGRSIIPPSGSHFLEEYLALQKKYNVGLDIWPAPDEYSTIKLIKNNQGAMKIGKKTINVETLETYLMRRLAICEKLAKESIETVRNFYFASRARYKARMLDYQKIARRAKKVGEEKTFADVKKLSRCYKKLMRKTYPEIFLKGSGLAKTKMSQLRGIVAVKADENLIGKVILADKIKRRQVKKGLIYVFKHFRPVDAKFIKIAKAIITEGGGITCHAALVCREFNLPCLVGVKGVTKTIKNDQRIELDFKKEAVIIKGD